MNKHGRIEEYFLKEYEYLQRAGEEFARKHPALGSRLRMTDRTQKDPLVERLLEAFAFLNARIHERLDDDVPEFSSGLLELLAPQFLRPFPACTIVEARHKPGMLTKSLRIPSGTEVSSGEMEVSVKNDASSGTGQRSTTAQRQETAEFIFRTTDEILVRPLVLVSARATRSSGNPSSLTLEFQVDKNVVFSDLRLDRYPLRIYLYGSDRFKYTLLSALAQDAVQTQIRCLGTDGAPGLESLIDRPRVASFAEEYPGPALFSGDHSNLLPGDLNIIPAYSLLLEYFSFPDRFFFVDFTGFSGFIPAAGATRFEIRTTLGHSFPYDGPLGPENFRLHCSPAINLFDRPTEPVPLTGRKWEYPVVPSTSHQRTLEVFSIRSVEASSSTGEARRMVHSLASGRGVGDPGTAEFYSVVRRPHAGGISDVYLRFIGDEDTKYTNLSIVATLSNGYLPSHVIGEGLLNRADVLPASVQVRNISTPTPTRQPPPEPDYLWTIMVQMTANLALLTTPGALCALLKLFDWPAPGENPAHRAIGAIKKLGKPKIGNELTVGGLFSVCELEIEIDTRAFEHGSGELSLFGSVLHRFLCEYLSMNTLLRLNLIESEGGRKHTWEASPGLMPPL